MDNKQIRNIKEEKIKLFYKAIHKPIKQDTVLTEKLDTKTRRNQGQKLSRKKTQIKKSITKKKST